jgi:hypothetical protein
MTMRLFKISERLVMSRIFSISADTAHAALDRFHDGKAKFLGTVPEHNKPLVTLHVIDTLTGKEVSEEQLQAEMIALVEGPYATGEELAAALTIPAPHDSRTDREIGQDAMEAELEINLALEDIEVKPATHSVVVEVTTRLRINVAAGSNGDAYDLASELYVQSEHPSADFEIMESDWKVDYVEKIPA